VTCGRRLPGVFDITISRAGERNYFRNGILQHLRRAQADNRLGLDLDLFAGLGVAAKARLAMSLYNATDPGNDELARATLGFLTASLWSSSKKEANGLLGGADLFPQCARQSLFCSVAWLPFLLLILLNCLSTPNVSRPAASEKPLFIKEKLGAEKDYSEGKKGNARGKQQKSLEKRTFFKGVCKTPSFHAVMRNALKQTAAKRCCVILANCV